MLYSLPTFLFPTKCTFDILSNFLNDDIYCLPLQDERSRGRDFL